MRPDVFSIAGAFILPSFAQVFCAAQRFCIVKVNGFVPEYSPTRKPRDSCWRKTHAAPEAEKVQFWPG
jgi:hypothetical protein